MDVRTGDRNRRLITYVSLFLGFSFYALFRPQVIAKNGLGLDALSSIHIPSWLFDAFPSFIFLPFICGLTLIAMNSSAGFLNLKQSNNRVWGTVLTWLSVTVLFEVLQGWNLGWLSRGTFDWQDIVAASLGAVLTLVLFVKQSRQLQMASAVVKELSADRHRKFNQRQTIPLFAAITLGLGSILGSVTEPCEGDDIDALCISPVVLSWQDIRKEIQPDISGNQVLTRSGKIYSLDHWLFIVEKYRGIHIFDVTDQLNPIRKVYLPIPGVLDLTIRDGILYASAFSDLVTLDLNLLLQSEGMEVSMARQEDVFEYPARQQFYPSYPEFYYTNYSERVSEDEGVVIGYKTKSGKVILYGDEYDFKKEEQRAEKEAEKDENVIANPACVLLLSWMCGAN